MRSKLRWWSLFGATSLALLLLAVVACGSDETPAPTPVPTPAPTPPSVDEIVSELEPWWDELTIVDSDGSLLRSVSYFAQRYLEQQAAGDFVSSR